jgi:hypothetical protein
MSARVVDIALPSPITVAAIATVREINRS